MHIERITQYVGRNYRAAGRLPRLACLVGLFTLLLAAAPLARAQDSPIKELASQMAASISAAKQKSAIVFDFVGPGDKFTALGPALADQFSAALAQSATTFTVADRNEIYDALQKKIYVLRPSGNDLPLTVMRDLGLQVAVLGKMSVKGANLIVSVEAYRADQHRLGKRLRISMPFTDAMRTLSDEVSDTETPLIYYSQPGKPVYTSPSCINCLPSQIAEEVAARRDHGTVILQAVIGSDGRARTILVMNGLPKGLTEKAIAAVQSRQFKPATGPDGKPTALITCIGVVFRLR